MAILTVHEARTLMLKGRPWTFRMEHTNGHNKFWLATGRGLNEPVEIHYGAIGAKPTILVKDWPYVVRAVPDKLGKGYNYTDTPFVRVQPSTIALSAAPSVPQFPTTKFIPVKPAVVPAAVAAPPVPTTVVVGQIPPAPWGRIMQVQKQPDGTWAGLSSTGTKVMGLTKDGARNLVRDYSHIQVVGL